MKDKCTLLLCTCDKYSDAWDPFFMCLKKNWKNFDMPIVLNTESKDYKFEGYDIKTFQFYKDRNVQWGERLIEHLKQIETEYVLFMLEDYFITKEVNEYELNKCIKWMDDDKNIAVFSLHRANFKGNIPSKKYKNYELRPNNGPYKFNCQTAIWRKDRLIKFILKNESPWDWELFGSIRSRKFKDEFYSIKEGIEPPIDFLGDAICRGVWYRPVVEPLFKEMKIDIDISIRGFSDENSTFVDNRTFFQKVLTKYKKIRAYIQSIF